MQPRKILRIWCLEMPSECFQFEVSCTMYSTSLCQSHTTTPRLTYSNRDAYYRAEKVGVAHAPSVTTVPTPTSHSVCLAS